MEFGTKPAYIRDRYNSGSVKVMSIKKVLIIEDEPTIRKTFVALLQDRYRVVAVETAREALQRFRKAKIDLIITDLKLADMSGLELIERFREAGYEGDVILISGYPDDVDTQVLLADQRATDGFKQGA